METTSFANVSVFDASSIACMSTYCASILRLARFLASSASSRVLASCLCMSAQQSIRRRLHCSL
jgi:hypothetical protein